MTHLLAAVIALTVPLVIVVALLALASSYLRRRPSPGTVRVRSRRGTQRYYWLAVAVVVGALGLISFIQHVLGGQPFVLGTWVVGVASTVLLAAGAGGFVLLARHGSQKP